MQLHPQPGRGRHRLVALLPRRLRLRPPRRPPAAVGLPAAVPRARRVWSAGPRPPWPDAISTAPLHDAAPCGRESPRRSQAQAQRAARQQQPRAPPVPLSRQRLGTPGRRGVGRARAAPRREQGAAPGGCRQLLQRHAADGAQPHRRRSAACGCARLASSRAASRRFCRRTARASLAPPPRTRR